MHLNLAQEILPKIRRRLFFVVYLYDQSSAKVGTLQRSDVQPCEGFVPLILIGAEFRTPLKPTGHHEQYGAEGGSKWGPTLAPRTTETESVPEQVQRRV